MLTNIVTSICTFSLINTDVASCSNFYRFKVFIKTSVYMTVIDSENTHNWCRVRIIIQSFFVVIIYRYNINKYRVDLVIRNLPPSLGLSLASPFPHPTKVIYHKNQTIEKTNTPRL